MTAHRDPLDRLPKGQREVVKHLLEIGTEDCTEVYYATVIFRDAFAGDMESAQRAAMQTIRYLVEIGFIALYWDDGSIEGRRHAELIPPHEAAKALTLTNEFVIPVDAAKRPRKLAYSATDLGTRY